MNLSPKSMTTSPAGKKAAEPGPRLLLAAGLVRCGQTVADIGTDHAALAVYLVRAGISPRVIATDNKKGPLANAAKNVALSGLGAQIELRLADGLTGIADGECGDIVIAGMGGVLITQILSRAGWLRGAQVHLVLQPMSHAEVLRRWLIENGFSILSENACFDGGRAYVCMQAVFTGVPVRFAVPEYSYSYIGELGRCAAPAAAFYLNRQAAHLKKRLAGLERTSAGDGEAANIKRTIDIISEVVHAKQQ